jgi:thymidylate synthase
MSKIDVTYHNLLKKILLEGYTYEDPNRKGVNRLEILSHTFKHEFKDSFPAITTKKLHYKNVVTELIWFLRGGTNIKYLVDNGCNIWNKDAYNYYVKTKDFIGGIPMDIKEFIERIKADKLSMSTRYYKLGDLGLVYGKQWRSFVGAKHNYDKNNGNWIANSVDQIARLIHNLKVKPLATDHIVNAWNPGDLPDMALPPCHYGFQVVVRPLNKQERLDVYLNSSLVTEYGFELHWNQRSVDTFLG